MSILCRQHNYLIINRKSRQFVYKKSHNLLTITALRDEHSIEMGCLLALPYYFFDEKMVFLGQSPFQRKEKRPCGMK